jgi:hypothetical protein
MDNLNSQAKNRNITFALAAGKIGSAGLSSRCISELQENRYFEETASRRRLRRCFRRSTAPHDWRPRCIQPEQKEQGPTLPQTKMERQPRIP